MNAFGLSGLGCDCANAGKLGAVADYDIITIGGTQYSANSIVDTTLIASQKVNLYRGSDFTTPYSSVSAGQPIGRVYSYIKESSATGQRAGGPLLMFYDSNNQAYYVKDDYAISQSALKEQGVLTVAEEVKKEQEAAARQADPVGYYLGKYGLYALLIGGAIYLAGSYGKEFIKDKIAK